MRTSTLSGRQYVQEVLACENPRRVQEIMRMPKDTFFALCTLLRAEGLLADTRNVAVEKSWRYSWQLWESAARTAVFKRPFNIVVLVLGWCLR